MLTKYNPSFAAAKNKRLRQQNSEGDSGLDMESNGRGEECRKVIEDIAHIHYRSLKGKRQRWFV